nr:unnamed protein product [Digitaria exilis]
MRGAKGQKTMWMEELSSEPRACLYHNFLSKKEFSHLIALAKPHMTRSRVVDVNAVGGKESSSDVREGGEAVFPLAKAIMSSSSNGGAKNGISVKPKMGDALLFWSMKPDGSRDPKSQHGANPVVKGSKWSATKWLHVREYKTY